MNLWYEINFTLRVLRKRFAFSALCVVVIALGYCITMPLYSFVKNLVYADLNFPDSQRLVFVRQTNIRLNYELDSVSFDTFQFNRLLQESTTLESLGAFYNIDTVLSDGAFAQQFIGTKITPTAFELTATMPLMGRSFLPRDALPGADPVVLISYGVWQNYYAADADIIGRVSRLNGEAHTVIGVMPPAFKYPQVAELWLPLAMAAVAQPKTEPIVAIVGKTVAGVSRAQASAETAAIINKLSAENPQDYADRSAKVTPFIHGFFSNALTMFNSIGGLAFCIYLLVCLNVGNLLIIRANERIGELAIRSAMGAKRGLLMRHVLLESLLICGAGALLGLAMAAWILNTLQGFLLNLMGGEGGSPFWFDFSLNADAVSMGVGMILLLWVLSGSFAAWRVSRQDISQVLGSEGQALVNTGQGRLMRGLVVAQVMLSFFLLVFSGSYLYTMNDSYVNSVLSNPERQFVASLDLSSAAYSDAGKRLLFAQQLQDKIGQLNYVESVTLASAVPGYYSGTARIAIDMGEPLADVDMPFHGVSWVGADYFKNFNFGLLQGRYFDAGDSADGLPVVIVDETFVKNMEFTAGPIGAQIRLRSASGTMALAGEDQLLRIVGVIPYIAPGNGSSARRIYRPLAQQTPEELQLILEVSSNASITLAQIESDLKLAAKQLDADVALHSVTTALTMVELANSGNTLFMGIFGSVAMGALVLSIIGIYGLMTRLVVARAGEIGIRRAVGSSNGAILRIFMGQGLTFLIIAAVFGGGLAVLAVNFTGNGSVLPTTDRLQMLAVVFGSVTAVLGGLVCWASYMPVKQVISLEPAQALHHQ